ncbi:hypothetical protein OG689_19545 [Kitasatospora sp. NBC_00240]|uniref:hypothetical protein n=1 Tax=Kitasatospora sp. NBC_00240 TaxID=2903567 RepID=UPI002250BC75|nr:hypothetical protein [Kitasatospora sp. NBC_00240]MCX5211456.1 hypothetical protein [Kitasatospora sp. NBC_00240]
MRIPGFTAESALYRESGQYRAAPSGRSIARPIGPQLVPQTAGVPLAYCRLECRELCRDVCARHPGSSVCRTCQRSCLHECLLNPK